MGVGSDDNRDSAFVDLGKNFGAGIHLRQAFVKPRRIQLHRTSAGRDAFETPADVRQNAVKIPRLGRFVFDEIGVGERVEEPRLGGLGEVLEIHALVFEFIAPVVAAFVFVNLRVYRTKNVVKIRTIMQSAQPVFVTGNEITFHPQQNFRTPAPLARRGLDQFEIAGKLVRHHANMRRIAIRHRGMTRHDDPAQPAPQCHLGILARHPARVFAERRVHVRLEKEPRVSEKAATEPVNFGPLAPSVKKSTISPPSGSSRPTAAGFVLLPASAWTGIVPPDLREFAFHGKLETGR